MVNFKEIYHFSRFQRGSNIFRGGGGGGGGGGRPTFSRGGGPTFSRGSNCLLPIETHITYYFPGGGGPDPLSPSGSALVFFQEKVTVDPLWRILSIMRSLYYNAYTIK